MSYRGHREDKFGDDAENNTAVVSAAGNTRVSCVVAGSCWSRLCVDRW